MPADVQTRFAEASFGAAMVVPEPWSTPGSFIPVIPAADLDPAAEAQLVEDIGS
jgi:hypothetical protein